MIPSYLEDLSNLETKELVLKEITNNLTIFKMIMLTALTTCCFWSRVSRVIKECNEREIEKKEAKKRIHS